MRQLDVTKYVTQLVMLVIPHKWKLHAVEVLEGPGLDGVTICAKPVVASNIPSKVGLSHRLAPFLVFVGIETNLVAPK